MMKLKDFVLSVIFITFFSLLYVYQQSEIFRMAYIGQKKAAFFQDLLDKNTQLRYNIEKSASVVRIGNKILESNDYEMPSSYQLVRLREPLKDIKVPAAPAQTENVFVRFFSIKRQAEAKTINP